ncbi:MAG: DHH family phosphoesterase [Bacteroidales bacterium]|nr:DHH family phosphoesterase [Bacteroidales bacterium]HOY40099.1 DHH family phosphoesterase [Bacteroidales bacterium]HQP03959.1 DHH family phosphoesterase [Bacteroidales bacterium]
MALIPKNSNSIVKFKEYVLRANHAVIIPHENPDGDAIGSALAMYHLFISLEKKAEVVCPNDFPAFLKWMPGNDSIVIASKEKQKAKALISEADLIICVDFNDITRMAVIQPMIKKAGADVILIDHHPGPVAFYNLLIHSTQSSSTAELIFEATEKAGFLKYANRNFAECIYVGIMTDTGSFNFNSSNSNTFRIVSKILKFGVNKDAAFDNVYNNFSASRMRLLGYALNKALVVLPELKTAYIKLTLKDLQDYGYQDGDTEGFVNYPLSVAGIKVSAIFIERKTFIKVSFRSKNKFAVNQFAAEYFKGGGHINAAGGEYHGSLDEAVEFFTNKIALYTNEIF